MSALRVRRRRHAPAKAARRTLAIEGAQWAWLQPSGDAHVAVLLHGKIGSLQDPPSWVRPDGGDARLVRLACASPQHSAIVAAHSHQPAPPHSPRQGWLTLEAWVRVLADASLHRGVLAANPRSTIDIFIHSWNPSLGGLIDGLYKPRWSRHEQELAGVTKVVSQSQSLRKALRAKQQAELHRGRVYELVLAARHDLVWYRPLVWARLPRAQLWLAGQCCNPDHGGGHVPRALELAVEASGQICLGNIDGVVSDLCTTGRFLRMGGGQMDLEMAFEAEYNYYVNDWLFLAPSATVRRRAALLCSPLYLPGRLPAPNSTYPAGCQPQTLPARQAASPQRLPGYAAATMQLPPAANLAFGQIQAQLASSRADPSPAGELTGMGRARYSVLAGRHLHGPHTFSHLLTPSQADTFMALATRHEAYRLALREVGVATEWMHFYWAAHIHHALQLPAGVRVALDAGTELGLARSAARGRYCNTNESIKTSLPRALPAVRGPVWGGLQHTLCPHPGHIRCAWTSHRCVADAVQGAVSGVGALELR